MRFVLRVLAVLALTDIYTQLVYKWEPLAGLVDKFLDSKVGEQTYVSAMHLAHLEGAENGENLLLAVFVIIALIAAIITTWGGSRFIVTPLCRWLATKTHHAR
jgi:hypothetical protein